VHTQASSLRFFLFAGKWNTYQDLPRLCAIMHILKSAGCFFDARRSDSKRMAYQYAGTRIQEGKEEILPRPKQVPRFCHLRMAVVCFDA